MFFVSSDLEDEQEIIAIKKRLLNNIYHHLFLVASVALVFAIHNDYLTQQYWGIPIYLAFYAMFLGLTVWKKAPFKVKAWFMVAFGYITGLITLLQDNMAGFAPIYFLVGIFGAIIFLKPRVAKMIFLVSLLTFGVFGVLSSMDLIEVPIKVLENLDIPGNWILMGAMMSLFYFLLHSTETALVPALIKLVAVKEQEVVEVRKERDALSMELIEKYGRLEVAESAARREINRRTKIKKKLCKNCSYNLKEDFE